MGVGFKYTCSNCEYSEIVSPDQFYLKNPDGRIEICDDDNLDRINDFFNEQEAWKALGSAAEKKTYEAAHSGYGASFLCRNCRHDWFERDSARQPKCPNCKSGDTVDKWYLRDGACPHCKTGKINVGQEPDWVS